MSMEVFVLSDKRLGSIAEWQQAIDVAGFALTLDGRRALRYIARPPASAVARPRGGFEM